MNYYKIMYTHKERGGSVTRDYVDYFEAANDRAAKTEANNRFPAGATNKKLYNIGTLLV